MILLSPDAVLDVERLRTFLDHHNPDAARRALAFDLDSNQPVAGISHLGDADLPGGEQPPKRRAQDRQAIA
jgi:hypothetical protein